MKLPSLVPRRLVGAQFMGILPLDELDLELFRDDPSEF
jgi:hypothetical protein